MSMKSTLGLLAAAAMMYGSDPPTSRRSSYESPIRKKLIPPPFSKKVSPLPKGHKIDIIKMQHECRGRTYLIDIEYSYSTPKSQRKRFNARVYEAIEYLRETPDNILMERDEFPFVESQKTKP